MDVKVGDKFLRVWDSEFPLGVVEVEEMFDSNRFFLATDSNGQKWSYLSDKLRAYRFGGETISILTPLNPLSKLLYLGE